MKIPEGATHYNAKNGHFYKEVLFGYGFTYYAQEQWKMISQFIAESEFSSLWSLSDDLTWCALHWDKFPLGTHVAHEEGKLYTFDEWYMRRLELGLEEIRTLGGGNPEDFEITYYKLSGGAQEKVMTALLMSMAVMTRVLDGEQCYNAASSAYWSIEEALETMEEIKE